MARTRIVIGIVVVILLAAAGYAGYQRYLAPVPPTPTPSGGATPSTPATAGLVSAEGKIEPARDATLAFRLSERVSQVLVAEGDTVAAGQPLVRLETADLNAAASQAEAAVGEARARVAVAQAQLDQVQAGARPEEIAAAQAEYKAAQAGVGQAAAQRDQVTKGATADAIAAAEAQLAQAQAQQKQLQITYDDIIKNIKYLAGPTEEKARFNLNAANQAVVAAQAALDQVRAGASAQTVQAYNSAVGVSAYQRDAAKARLQLLQAGPSAEQMAVARAQLQQAQAGLDAANAGLQAAQVQLAQATLLAPFAGIVTRLSVEVGELATPGAPAVSLADLSAWRMQTTDLAETDVVLVRPGQAASVTLDAFPGQKFDGTISEISNLSETNRGNTTYAVTIKLAPTSAALRWGMTAFADIHVQP
jgi:multidrug efflux pump subunit AcrA (membrane-fusion protein)